MRMSALPLLAVGTLTLAGCATSPLGGLFGGGFDDRYDRNRGSQFERAAVDACAREANRYGHVRIRDARQIERDIVEVRGQFRARNNRARNFRCAFRSDGRVVGFDS